jgi:hypothetical protein
MLCKTEPISLGPASFCGQLNTVEIFPSAPNSQHQGGARRVHPDDDDRALGACPVRASRWAFVAESAFASGRMVMWNDVNLNVLGRMRNLLTPHNALVLDHYARIRQAAWPMRLWLLWKSGVYRQSFIDNLGLFLGALSGRL